MADQAACERGIVEFATDSLRTQQDNHADAINGLISYFEEGHRQQEQLNEQLRQQTATIFQTALAKLRRTLHDHRAQSRAAQKHLQDEASKSVKQHKASSSAKMAQDVEELREQGHKAQLAPRSPFLQPAPLPPMVLQPEGSPRAATPTGAVCCKCFLQYKLQPACSCMSSQLVESCLMSWHVLMQFVLPCRGVW